MEIIEHGHLNWAENILFDWVISQKIPDFEILCNSPYGFAIGFHENTYSYILVFQKYQNDKITVENMYIGNNNNIKKYNIISEIGILSSTIFQERFKNILRKSSDDYFSDSDAEKYINDWDYDTDEIWM